MKKNYLAEMILDDVKDTASRIDFSMLSNKSILITGASGLIGTYLLATLTQARRSNNLTFQITLVVHSKLSSYMRELIDSNDKCIQVDLSDYTKVSKLDCYDFIFHAAGYGNLGNLCLILLKQLL